MEADLVLAEKLAIALRVPNKGVSTRRTPKAGVFSERQAAVAADRIAEVIRGGAGSAEYDGRGLCYLEFGDSEVARVEVTFLSGQPPTGTFASPSEALAAEKSRFGTSRARRWFGREWSAVEPGS